MCFGFTFVICLYVCEALRAFSLPQTAALKMAYSGEDQQLQHRKLRDRIQCETTTLPVLICV